jgi:ribonuclease BN (tRNA processing enzyme)
MCVRLPKVEEPVERFPEFMRPVTRRAALKSGVVAGTAAMLGGLAPSRAMAGKPSHFTEHIHRQPPYPANGTSLVLLGAAGGPDAYFMHGTAAAVVCRRAVYLVDFGIGMRRQFMFARLHPGRVRAGFLTHSHSDHMYEVYPFFSTAYYYLNPPYTKAGKTIRLFGPPSAATNAPAGSNGLPAGDVTLNPANPTPGFVDLMRSFVEGPYAYDNNLRMRDEGMPDLLGLGGGAPQLLVSEVDIPATANFTNVAPDMDPIDVYEDELVKVRAILVQHAPVFPAFAYRFDTPDGSITFSGDTAASANLIKLARGSDVIAHEVIHGGYLKFLIDEAGLPPQLITHLLSAHTPDRTLSAAGATYTGVGTIARRAHAKQLLLYHLVPGMDFDAEGRAYDIPKREWEKHPNRDFDRKVHVGRDLLRIDL